MEQYLIIDVGGTNIKSALMQKDGTIKSKKQLSTAKNLDDFKEQILSLVAEVAEKIQGVAFSIPGKVDPHSAVVYHGGALPFIDGLDLKRLVHTEAPDVAVSAENDGKAGALGEYWQGSLKGHPNSAIITLGTGVGGGLILNGQIFRGSHFQAGELSFLYGGKLEDKPILYGLRGSAVKMIHDIGKALHFENPDDGKAAFQAIMQKEEQAVTIFENYCRDIAILILDMHAMLDLTHYAIGGGISAQPILIEEINRQYDLLADSILDRGIKIVKLSLQRPQIIAATLGNDANLYGALYGLVNTEK